MTHHALAFLPACARAPLAVLLLALSLPGAVTATDDTLSLSCAVCHGTVQAPSRVPDLHALDAPQISTMLREFRAGTRTGTAMPRLSLSLSDTEIEALALRFGRTAP